MWSWLRGAVGDDVALRRALGYTIRDTERLLADCVDFLEQRGAAVLSTELALDLGHRTGGESSPELKELVLRRCAAYQFGSPAALDLQDERQEPSFFERGPTGLAQEHGFIEQIPGS